MKSLERRFKKAATEKNNLFLSSYVHFTKAIRGQKFNRKKIIHFWFNKLVEKDDYDKKDRRDVLKFLEELSNS